MQGFLKFAREDLSFPKMHACRISFWRWGAVSGFICPIRYGMRKRMPLRGLILAVGHKGVPLSECTSVGLRRDQVLAEDERRLNRFT